MEPPGSGWSATEGAGAAPERRRVISQAHKAADLPSPTISSLVRRTHAGIRRTIGTARAAKAPAMVSDLKRMLDQLPATRVGLTDRALLLLGFAGAFRRAELVGLDVGHLEFSSARLVVVLRRAKTDQEGRSRRIGIPYGLLREDLPGALSTSVARVGAHFRRARVQVIGQVSARAEQKAVRQGCGAHRQAPRRGGGTRS